MKKKRVASYIKLRTQICNLLYKVLICSFIVKVTTKSLEKKEAAREARRKRSSSTLSMRKIKETPPSYHITFGDKIESRKSMKEGNKVRTQRYTAFSWAPCSLML